MGIGVTVLLPLALVAIMFTLGLGLTVEDFRRVGRNPRIFLAGAFGQLLLLPAVAYAIAMGFGLARDMALGLMILSLCPGGPTSNILTRIANGDVALSISLTAVISMVSVVTVPPLTGFFASHLLGLEAPPVSVAGLAYSMVLITLVPVVLGMLVNRHASAWAAKAVGPATRFAAVLAAVIIAAVLVLNWSLFIANLPTVGPACVALVAAMLLGGILIGRVVGGTYAEQTTIAIDTGLQNGTLGITVAALITADTVAQGVSPYAIPSGVYGIIMYAAAVPFAFWRASRAA